MNTKQTKRPSAGSLSPASAAILGIAAQASEALRAKAKPLDELAWELDSAAAMIRRHQNGNDPNPNGTPEEYAALEVVIEAAKDALVGRTPEQIMLEASLVSQGREAVSLLGLSIRLHKALMHYAGIKAVPEALSALWSRFMDGAEGFDKKVRFTDQILDGDKVVEEAGNHVDDMIAKLFEGAVAGNAR